MKIHTLLTALAGSTLLFTSCGNNTSENKAAGATTASAKPAPLPAVTLGTVTPSPEFPNAAISIASVSAQKVGKDSAKVSFAFNVKNYELKMQTSDNANKMCNNSDKGQHIHFILDNGPYKALYEPKNEITLPNDGKEHYLMAFLSRSYHESVKTKGAAVVYHFKIDEKGNLKKLEDPTKPMIFYSRPKGDYMGNDVNNVLLDFYVWNCSLSPTGYKVKAEITNEAIPSQKLIETLEKWEPRFIQNLGLGKCKVELSLMDKDGTQIDGPRSREFSLSKDEVSATAPKADTAKK